MKKRKISKKDKSTISRLVKAGILGKSTKEFLSAEEHTKRRRKR
jgi:hypothetical protein